MEGLTMLLLFSNSLVLVGIIILTGSLVTVRKITQRLPLGSSRNSWYAMAALISFFVLGYLGYMIVFWNKHTGYLDLIVPGIFFFGACFVWLSSVLALQTAMDVMRITALEHETFTDPLTGIYNRRFMEQRLREEISKARRYEFKLAVLLLDLDHFKQINDELGHQAGDQMLIEISDLLNRELRDSDILARYGGEEFLVIAPSTPPTDAAGLAERLRECIATRTFLTHLNNAQEPGVQMTVSIGVANFGGSTNDQESLIQVADQNLYQAKHGGRNQVVAEAPND
jgi:diguanylate cyclase (GGDEF)-like protein